MFLNESYYGKTDKVLAIEKAFKDIQTTTKEEDTEEGAPKFTELCRAISAFTNTGVRLDVEDGALCYVIYEKYPDAKVKMTKQGLRFTDPYKLDIFITYGTEYIYKTNKKFLFTPGELTAITIHEIGHVYAPYIIPIEDSLELLRRAINIKTGIYLKGDRNLNREKDDMKLIVSSITDYLKKRPVTEIFSDMVQSSSILVKNILAKLFPFSDKHYIDEKIADSYATAYGYGAELSSALNKIDKRSKSTQKDKNRLVGGVLALIMETLFDEHPNTLVRINETITQLEYDAKKEKNPIRKKQLESDIRGVRAALKQYELISKSSNYNTSVSIYRKTLASILPFSKGDVFGILVSDLYGPEVFDANA